MKRMRMILSVVLASLLLLGSCAQAESFTAKEIETLGAAHPFDSGFGQISITQVDEKPLFSPAEMTADQRAVMISLSVPPAFLDDLAKADKKISSEFLLFRPTEMFSPGVVLRGSDENGTAAVSLVFAIPGDSALEEYRLMYGSQARTLLFTEEAAASPPAALEDISFTLGGVRYTLDRLDDAPFLALPNRLDALEGHVVAFGYEVSAAKAKDANDKLYSNTRLIQPDGREVRVYSNADNLGNPYELYFGLSDGVLLADCTLLVPTDEGEKRFPLSGHSGAESAAITAPDDLPAEEPVAADPAPSLGSLAETVSGLLSELAQEESDPWRLAIYQAGAQDMSAEDEKLSFMLRSFNPGLKSLGSYKNNKENYLSGLLDNAAAYNLKVELPLKDGAVGETAKAAIKKAVTKAAAASKEAFGESALRLALSEYLFPMEGYEDEELALLLRAQAKQTLSVKGGPHALSLRCSGANPEAVLDNARADVLEAFSKEAGANESDWDVIREALMAALDKRAANVRKKPCEEFVLTIDIDSLAQGDIPDYDAYLARYIFEDTLDTLVDEVHALPDAPPQPFPKTGRISGSTSGTKVIVKVPDDGLARYVQLRNDKTGAMMVSAFIRPGGSCTVRVPRGDCYILVASGTAWYGEKLMFGDKGSYARTEAFEVMGSNYYHTITLGGVKDEDANMRSYGASMDDFK